MLPVAVAGQLVCGRLALNSIFRKSLAAWHHPFCHLFVWLHPANGHTVLQVLHFLDEDGALRISQRKICEKGKAFLHLPDNSSLKCVKESPTLVPSRSGRISLVDLELAKIMHSDHSSQQEKISADTSCGLYQTGTRLWYLYLYPILLEVNYITVPTN